MLGLTAIPGVIRGTWKIWLPVILVIISAGALWAQHQKIESLKDQRDVAIVEHDRALEEQKQLLNDIDRLNEILLQRQAAVKRLEIEVEDAKNRIRKLADNRPDVADWRNAALPNGLWQAAIGVGSPDGDPPGADRTSDSSQNNPNNQR